MRFLIAALTLAIATPSLAADVKLGFVDLQRALNEVEEGGSAKKALKKEFDEKQKQLDAKQDELRRLRAEYDKQAVVMSEQAKRDKQAELERKAGETQQLFVQLQSELSRREQEVTGPILEKLGNAVREIAEAEGFTAIFERNRSGVLYMTDVLDLTSQVVRKYNARPPAKKGEPAKPAAPAAHSGRHNQWRHHSNRQTVQDPERRQTPVRATGDLLADGAAENLRLLLRPGCALLSSAWPVAAIWQGHQRDGEDRFAEVRAAFAAGRGDNAFVWRDGFAVRVDALDDASAAFTRSILLGTSLAGALDAAGDGFAFDQWLVQALQKRWLVAVQPIDPR